VNVGQGAAALRIRVKATAGDLGEGSWNCRRQNGLVIAGCVPDGELLGEGFDDGDAQGPDVGAWRDGIGGDLRSDVYIAREEIGYRFPEWNQTVGGEPDVVLDDEDVGRLEMAVREAIVVEIVEGAEDGREHLARFFSGEWTLGDDLREKLFGEVADDVDARVSIDLGTAEVIDMGQVGL